MRPKLFVSLLLCLLVSPSWAKPQTRQPRIRTLRITDDNASVVHELYVAGNVPTTLILGEELQPGAAGYVLAAPPQDIPKPMLTGRNFTLGPERDIPRASHYVLTLSFADGSVQSFKLVSSPTVWDVQVRIELNLSKRIAPQSVSVLQSSNEELRAQLDECHATGASAGIAKVANFILTQDFQKPTAFTAERIMETQALDKQQRLHIKAEGVYRLFGQTYVVLLVTNRDPIRSWVFDRPEVSVSGGGANAEVRVTTYLADLTMVPPEQKATIVIGFESASQATDQRYNLALFEKGGGRNVVLEGVEL